MVTELDKLTDTQRVSYQNYVHMPSAANAAFNTYAKNIYGSEGISTGSRVMDAVVIPTRPGWLRIWNAPSGNKKTTQLQMMAMHEARRLVRENKADKKYVALVVYEETVESTEQRISATTIDSNAFYRGRINPESIANATINRPGLPIVVFGTSLMKTKIGVPPMTIEMVMAGIEAIDRHHDMQPSAIIVDYAQVIEVEQPTGNRTLDVINAMNDVVHLSKQVDAAVELGVQANSRVLDYQVPIPGPKDTEYSHYIHQVSSAHMGGWYPWSTHSKDPDARRDGITIGGHNFRLTPWLQVWRSNKHRHGVLDGTVAVEYDHRKMEIRDFPVMVQKYIDEEVNYDDRFENESEAGRHGRQPIPAQ